MSYVYTEQKQAIFTDEGQRQFLAIRDNVQRLLKQAGAVRMQEAMSAGSGDSWEQMACVDRLVELGEIVEVTKPGVMGQYRIFTVFKDF